MFAAAQRAALHAARPLLRAAVAPQRRFAAATLLCSQLGSAALAPALAAPSAACPAGVAAAAARRRRRLAASRQRRCGAGKSSPMRFQGAMTPRGHVNAGARQGGGSVTSLGCVLHTHVLDWDKYGSYGGWGHRLGVLWRMVMCVYQVKKLQRGRDDCNLDGFQRLYTTFKVAHSCRDTETLRKVLSVYEFQWYENRLKDERNKMSLKERNKKRVCQIKINKRRYVYSDFFDMQGEEFSQVHVYFESELTETVDGKEEPPHEVKEYCVFEVRVSARATESVAHPIKIAGLVDEFGDRIGKDTVNPQQLKEMMKSQEAAAQS
eukprot:TRINITY_DN4497_c1_g1_i1.p1 TRINITY_DN4497_c1_g1~~TRINITY_DN4497_c1_g1_i1.p1  ORF type:complete len:350 (+),score=120.13 TRINITY_DN4497_c1_g1_i1:88-1050(+)